MTRLGHRLLSPELPIGELERPLKYVVDHGFALAKYRADERAAAQAVAAAVVAVGRRVYLGFRSASLAQRIGKVAMKRAANRPPQGTPRHRGNGRDEVLAKLKCSMRAVQSYLFRKPAPQVLPDRSPANAAFVAWYAPFQINGG